MIKLLWEAVINCDKELNVSQKIAFQFLTKAFVLCSANRFYRAIKLMQVNNFNICVFVVDWLIGWWSFVSKS